MKNTLKAMMASWVILLATFISANHAFAEASKNPKLKTGTFVTLSESDVVWHKDNVYVIDYNDRYYEVKTDDDGNAIVLCRVNNLADFVQNNGTRYVTRAVPGIYAGPIYQPWFYSPFVVRTPVVVHHYPWYHPHVVVVHKSRKSF